MKPSIAPYPQIPGSYTLSDYASWFSLELISNLKLKEYYRHNKWKASKNVFFWGKFRRIRALCKEYISRAYKSFVYREEDCIWCHPKEIFKLIRPRKGESRLPGKMHRLCGWVSYGLPPFTLSLRRS